MTYTINQVFELLKTTDKKFWHMDYFGRGEFLQGYDSAVRRIRAIHYHKVDRDGEPFKEIILLSQFLTKFSDPMWKDGWIEYGESEIFGQTFSPDEDPYPNQENEKCEPRLNIQAFVNISPQDCPIPSSACCNCANCRYFQNIYKGSDGLMWISCNYTKSE